MKSRHLYCTQTAVAALLIGLTAAAQAQTADSMETVTVTGFRASLATALAAKQNSNLVMESVAAEDIGKMPDQDVAESLQRLPGVQITRDQGKGATVLINGLRQNLTTLNGDVFLTGKEFYTYGEASGGGAGGNMQYNSLSTIPSEEIGGIDVYKSPNAALTEGGMGGILNLKTRDPLTAPEGLSVAANAHGTSTSLNSFAKLTPGGTLVGFYKPSSKFAVTASVSYDDVTTKTQEMEAYNRQPWVLTTLGVSGYKGVGPIASTTVDPTKNPAYVASCPGPSNAATWQASCPNPATNVEFLTPGSFTANSGQTNISKKYLLPEYMYFSDILDQSKTIGSTASVSWAPTSAITTSFTWFYAHNWDRTTNYSNKVAFNGSGAESNVPGKGPAGINADAPYTISDQGIIQSGTFYLQGAETATLVTVFNSDAANYQWHTAYDDGGPLTATLDVAYSRATSNLSAAQQDIEHGYYTARNATASAAPNAPGCNNMSPSCAVGNPAIQVLYSNGGSSGLPTAKYIGAYADVLSNPAYALFKSAWAWNNMSKQDQSAIRGAATYKPSFLSSIEGSFTGGFRLASRNIWQTFGRYLIDRGSAPVGDENCCISASNGNWLYYQDPGYDVKIPYDTAVSNPGLARTVNNFMFGNMIVKDPVNGGMQNPATFLNTIWNQAKIVPSGAKVPNNTEAFFPDTLSSFKVHETTQALYMMTDLGTKEKGFHINGGVRVVFTKQLISGASSAPEPTSYGTASWNGVNNNNIPFTAGHSTVDVLPSINIALYPTDNQIIRLAAARVMSPADLFNLGLGQSFNFTRETGGRTNVKTGQKDGFKFATGNAGNPRLDPYRATQFNVSWEDYFAPQALLSVGAFYKQIESFEVVQPVSMTVMDDFGGTEGTVQQAQNAGHGSIYGFELSGQYVLDMGLGIAANYTYTQSQSAIETAFSKHLAVPGVAPHAATATIFYENFGFDARMSYAWRSSSVNGTVYGSTLSPTDTTGTTYGTFGTKPPYAVYMASYGQLDAQIGYDVTDYLNVYVSAQNLTEEASHAYLQYKDQPFFYDKVGSRYFFGIRAKY